MIADQWDRARFERIFNRERFADWAAGGALGKPWSKEKFFSHFDAPAANEEPTVRYAFQLLRRIVCTKAHLNRLAAIGPCAIHD